jgi:hypothetical protein
VSATLAAGTTTAGASAGAGAGGAYDDGMGGSSARYGDGEQQPKQTMLVFVVGGLSYLEIAAYRFLSRDPGFPYRILLATTKLVNGSTLLASVQHSVA